MPAVICNTSPRQYLHQTELLHWDAGLRTLYFFWTIDTPVDTPRPSGWRSLARWEFWYWQKNGVCLIPLNRC